MSSFNKLSISARIAAQPRAGAHPVALVSHSVRQQVQPVPVSRSVRSVVSTGAPVLGPGALNTHFFDGKIHYALDLIAPYLEQSSKADAVTKLREFEKLKQKITNPGALRCFDAIVRDFDGAGRTASSGNWDSTNGLYACDLLYAICVNSYENGEIVKLLESQLIDMQTGLCPQGRTTRLVQCIWSLLT